MFEPGEDENEHEEHWEPGPEVTRELFLKWRDARRGEVPGEVMTNPVWRWLIDSNISAYRANDHFQGPGSHDGVPGWCFNRFGRSLTVLPDGRKIIIAGEHEDHYDPDFFIYNDVVVVSPDGEIEILGYPEDHFPPTDFHSATLVGDELILIGNLSYPEQRRMGCTQVYGFDVAKRLFRQIDTTGENPGWISSHQAALVGSHEIEVKGGKIDHGPDGGSYLDNHDSWRLDLRTWVWTRTSHYPVERWRFVRVDGGVCQLFPKRMLRMGMRVGCGDAGEDAAGLDVKLLDGLYDPPVDHDVLVDDDFSERTRYAIDGIEIQIAEEMNSVRLTILGILPDTIVVPYVEAIRERLSRLENAGYEAVKQSV